MKRFGSGHAARASFCFFFADKRSACRLALALVLAQSFELALEPRPPDQPSARSAKPDGERLCCECVFCAGVDWGENLGGRYRAGEPVVFVSTWRAAQRSTGVYWCTAAVWFVFFCDLRDWKRDPVLSVFVCFCLFFDGVRFVES